MITEPGLYPDVDFAEYLADPVEGRSLSHTGIKTLVKSTPAHFAHQREHGRPDTAAFDVGHAAHAEVLGVGMPVAVIPDELLASNGATSTKAAKQFIDEARSAGKTPIKQDVADQITAMAEALRAHPIAGRMFLPGHGQPEVTAVAIDPDSGVTLRARYDWWHDGLISDYKTAESAHPDKFSAAAFRYGYHVQDAVYSHIARLLGHRDVDFRFVVQETTAPYLVNVVELDVLFKRVGAMDMRDGIAIYRRCTETGQWPGYSDDETTLLSAPAWVERAYELELVSNA